MCYALRIFYSSYIEISYFSKFMSQISYHRFGMIDFVYYYVNFHFTITTLSIKESDN